LKVIKTGFASKPITALLLALLFGLALFPRVYLYYDYVFGSEQVRFTEVDAYYHMRLVDNMLHHFPQRITFDPYTSAPHGNTVGWPPFFDWLVGGSAWLFGLGSPSEHLLDVVAAYIPAILGALIVIPVYFLGRVLFNHWAGLLSAGVIAVLPGDFMARSTIGNPDHHAAEILFTTIALLFLILALKSAKSRRLTFNQLRQRQWSIVCQPLVYSLLAGIFFGIYLLTWVGGLLFLFLVFLYFVIQFIIDHLRRENTEYLALIGTPCLLITLVVTMPFLPQSSWLHRLYLPSFLVAILTPLLLAGISSLLVRRRTKPLYYPLIILTLGLAGLGVFYLVEPSLAKSMLGRFSVFVPGGASLTIAEVQPLLLPGGSFSLSLAWIDFTTTLWLALIALGIIIGFIIKRNNAEYTLLVVWSLLMLAATLGQRRFAYYLAVNVALLTGYLSWRILDFAISWKSKKQTRKVARASRKKTRARAVPKRTRVAASYLRPALVGLVVFFVVFFPNIQLAITSAKQPAFPLSDDWNEALFWLKENTPEPFGNPEAYYQIYEPPPSWKDDYDYPDSAYSVIAWWDYGHWITRIAHRIAVANPFQDGAHEVAQFFTAQDEISANAMLQALDSRYIIVSDSVVTDTIFSSMIAFAGSSQDEFFGVYYWPIKGQMTRIRVFNPAYYQSLAVRLYSFDGREAVGTNSVVISYVTKTDRNGKSYREISSLKSYPTYEEAQAYISSQTAGNYEIVGLDRFVSPVPLSPLNQYRLVYSSGNLMTVTSGATIPSLKIFEYVAEP
jgi:dolichyl-diphosphooligosaccharide--protein glycosyltransferase